MGCSPLDLSALSPVAIIHSTRRQYIDCRAHARRLSSGRLRQEIATDSKALGPEKPGGESKSQPLTRRIRARAGKSRTTRTIEEFQLHTVTRTIEETGIRTRVTERRLRVRATGCGTGRSPRGDPESRLWVAVARRGHEARTTWPSEKSRWIRSRARRFWRCRRWDWRR
jgi:hypothetical protein